MLIPRTAQILSVHGAQVDRLRHHDALRLDERDESRHSGHSVALPRTQDQTATASLSEPHGPVHESSRYNLKAEASPEH